MTSSFPATPNRIEVTEEAADQRDPGCRGARPLRTAWVAPTPFRMGLEPPTRTRQRSGLREVRPAGDQLRQVVEGASRRRGRVDRPRPTTFQVSELIRIVDNFATTCRSRPSKKLVAARTARRASLTDLASQFLLSAANALEEVRRHRRPGVPDQRDGPARARPQCHPEVDPVAVLNVHHEGAGAPRPARSVRVEAQ